jgi:3-isopropylmalate/(R)-2-methylmalate dehydratase small subunit
MSDAIIRGSVWKYGDNINTDIISPPRYMELSIEEASKYAMSPIDPDFSTKFKKGDILVAGYNFGPGSSRETSPLSLKYLGVNVIIAKSFARIFYRNSINVGILVLECPDTDKIKDHDVLEIDYQKGRIKNVTKNEVYPCSEIPKHLMKLIELGGLVPYLKEL